MRHAGHVLVVVVTFLVLSLAIYDCRYTGFSRPGEYDLDIRHTRMGLPGWLVHNRVTVKGRLPLFDHDFGPDADQYRPGFLFLGSRFALALAAALLAAFLVYAGGCVLLRRLPALAPTPSELRSTALVITLAILVGIALPRKSPALGLFLSLILLPGVIAIVAARERRYLHVFLTAALAIAMMSWSSAISALTVHGVHPGGVLRWEDLVFTTVLFAGYVALGSLSVMLSRLRKRRKSVA